MLARSVALAIVLALSLAPVLRRSARPRPVPSCVPEGRGEVPRHWLGCAADPGPRRALEAEERLVLGLPIDPNTAGERALAQVPGLSPRLARAVVEHRAVHGPFRTVEDLLDVKGIGPRRLERARARLAVVVR
ncbi:MAG TPA: helix-hairpin-helix domain-containing protein [Anaeromyxobacter sp.]|nr:helix-hairpin-helix domain-containing protein [Anaeromyxobacter sp.]